MRVIKVIKACHLIRGFSFRPEIYGEIIGGQTTVEYAKAHSELVPNYLEELADETKVKRETWRNPAVLTSISFPLHLSLPREYFLIVMR